MKNKRTKIYAIILIIISVLTMVFTPLTAFASTTENVDITTSSVRDDLASMGEDKLSYRSDSVNIFIAMSQYYDNSGKLRTYVYLNYIGSIADNLKITISTAVNDEHNNITESYMDYPLQYVNNDSTWVKYEVLNLPNLEFVTRRYNVSRISFDTKAIISSDRIYIFHGITNDSIKVLKQNVETIVITDKEVSFFCFGEQSEMYNFFGVEGALGNNKKYTDAWYIFFNTDRPIDDLYEIEITYKPYTYNAEHMQTCDKTYRVPVRQELQTYIQEYHGR